MNVSRASNQHIIMISEGSEEWRNDAENSALIKGKIRYSKLHFTTYIFYNSGHLTIILNCNNISQYYF